MTDSQENVECPVTAILEVIGGKWKPIILYNLTFGTRRFGQIDVCIPRISRKVLTEQLRSLEKDGLITRKEYKEIPPRVEYSLTELGESLTPVLHEMSNWAKEHILEKQ